MSREQDSPPTVPDRADYDSPWKKALEVYFKEFIDFFFREMAADVDWRQEHVFLDKELQQVAREAALGRSLRPVGPTPRRDTSITCPPVPVFASGSLAAGEATCPPLPCVSALQLPSDRGAGRRVAGGSRAQARRAGLVRLYRQCVFGVGPR